MNPLPRLLDLVFPRRCCACGQPITHDLESGLCWDCRSDTHPIAPPWCEQCGMPIAGRIDHAFRCARCEETDPAYTRARSLFRYEGGVREAIHAFKYRRDFSVLPDLARLLAAGLGTYFPEVETLHLVPVPLHPRKLRQRGFNQSRELAKGVCRHLPHANVCQVLARIKHTETQTHLSASARRRNVQGAFKATASGIPETLILLDDVMTTGSTVDACAKALKKAGAKEVNVITIARG
jgi:competence protein ComFC